MKKYRNLVFILFFVFLFVGCGASSRTSVDPWPGLFRLKETNKKGYETQKKRNKRLKKQTKKRLNTCNYVFDQTLKA